MSVAPSIVLRMEASFDALRDLAVRHLPSDTAGKWVELLRPGIRLGEGTQPGPVVGQFGGLPRLPAEVEWPVWEGYGPLSLIASVDCAALPAGVLDIPLPDDGLLLFFCFDQESACEPPFTDSIVVGIDPEPAKSGARVLYVPAGVPAAEREAPEGLTPLPREPLCARATTTAPDMWHVSVRDVFAPDQPLDEFNHFPEGFLEGCEELELACADSPHQIGGHADPVQHPLETDIAHHLLGGDASDDSRLSQEARAWVLLGHFYNSRSDGYMHWLIRPQDLAERRFEEAMYIFDC